MVHSLAHGYIQNMFRWLSNLVWRLAGRQRRYEAYQRKMSQFRGNFYDVRSVQVSLQRLDPDLPDPCPVPLNEIVEYVETEEMELKQPPSLQFLRTALIAQTRYWIWTYTDNDNNPSYAVVAQWPNGSILTHCDGTFDMTPEQYLLATHFDIEP